MLERSWWLSSGACIFPTLPRPHQLLCMFKSLYSACKLMGDGRGSQGCSVGRNSGVCHFLLALFSISSFPYLRLQVPDSKNSPGSCSCYYTAPDYFSGSPTCKLVPKHPWCVKHWAVFVPVWVESVNPCPKDTEILRSETGME